MKGFDSKLSHENKKIGKIFDPGRKGWGEITLERQQEIFYGKETSYVTDSPKENRFDRG